MNQYRARPRYPCDFQGKYGIGHRSHATEENPDRQAFLSVFMQTGNKGGLAEHVMHTDKYVQWVVIMPLDDEDLRHRIVLHACVHAYDILDLFSYMIV